VPNDVEPPELAALLDYAERPRGGDWSLRAALTRYAQPQPQRVGDLLELIRRIEFALPAFRSQLDEDGPDLWQAAQDDAPTNETLVGVLRAMVQLDRLGDALTVWAADPATDRPDDQVDATIADVARRIEELGLPREERQRPPNRSRG
jgi:hypothetical protein